MAYNDLNYLLEVKHIQELAKEKIRRYKYITYVDIWKELQEEKKFFKSYNTFLKYMGEPNINGRIEKYNNRGDRECDPLQYELF